MITKFLYKIDERNRKIISGVVENSEDSESLAGKPFPMVDIETYQAKSDEVITINYGKQVYIVFEDDGKKYLDIDTFNDQVKINITDNINYACCFSREMMAVLLANCDYFGYDDCTEIPNGMFKDKRGIKDVYDKMFRKVVDKTFCQIKQGNKSFFVAYDQKYYLTSDFTKAIRIRKNELRKILVINGFINEKMDFSTIAFSPYPCFVNETSFLFFNKQPMRIRLIENKLFIATDNLTIDENDRLFNSEKANDILKEIESLLANVSTNRNKIALINGAYLKKDGSDYELVNDPFLASLVDVNEIVLFRTCLSLFVEHVTYQIFDSHVCYVYENEEKQYFVGKKPESFVNAWIISTDVGEKFNQLFNKSLDFSKRISGTLIIRENKYLQIEICDKFFLIDWKSSAYEASVFTDAEYEVLTTVFKWQAMKKEISNLLLDGGLNRYNIKFGSNPPLVDEYQGFLDMIASEKHRMCSFTGSMEIKYESKKGSLEYLRRHYAKGVNDAKELYTKILTDNPWVKNILVVGSGCNMDLHGLSDIAQDKEINFATVDMSKWGYYPPFKIEKNIKYHEAYRCRLIDLPKSILAKYDLIVFSKNCNEKVEDLKPILSDLIRDNKNRIFADVRICNVGKNQDAFYDAISDDVRLKRKYFTDNDYQELLGIVEQASEKMLNICKCGKKACVNEPLIIKKENSYHCIAIKYNGMLFDYYDRRGERNA